MPLKKDTRDWRSGRGKETCFSLYSLLCFLGKKFFKQCACIIFLIKKKVCVGEGEFKKILRFYLASQVLFPPCLCAQVLTHRPFLSSALSAPAHAHPSPTPPPGSITTSHRYLKPTFSPRNTNNSNLERRLSFTALTEQTEISWLWDARWMFAELNWICDSVGYTEQGTNWPRSAIQIPHRLAHWIQRGALSLHAFWTLAPTWPGGTFRVYHFFS